MQTACNHESIELFLSNQLSESDQRAFEKHLDECDSCCDELRELTAGQDWWNEARCFLSSVDGAVADTQHDHVPLDFLSPTDDPRMLGRFAGYEVAGVIGQGGMAIVLKALDPALNRYAAIKVLAPHFASSAAARQRFAREAQAAAAVLHDNVIAIHGVGEANNLPYPIMPYVRGESLQKRIDKIGALSVEEILRISLQTARGLAAAHDQGLVHRDIKPANILLPDGVERVMITDFGLARAADDASLTRSGVIAGTPQYMSPEQAQGNPMDARSDLFSLGSVMYAMCTGRLPFRAPTPFGILRRITDNQPRAIREINPLIPDWLCRIVANLHAKSRDDRYDSAAEVADLLQQCLAYVQTTDAPLPAGLGRPRRVSLKHWLGGAVAFAAAGLMAWGIRSNDEPPAALPKELPGAGTGITAGSDWTGLDDPELTDLEEEVRLIEGSVSGESVSASTSNQ